jgi:hypothetical protein
MPLFFNYDPDDEDLFQFDSACAFNSLSDIFHNCLTKSERDALFSNSQGESSTALGERREIPASYPERQIIFYTAPALFVIRTRKCTPEEVRFFKSRWQSKGE